MSDEKLPPEATNSDKPAFTPAEEIATAVTPSKATAASPSSPTVPPTVPPTAPLSQRAPNPTWNYFAKWLDPLVVMTAALFVATFLLFLVTQDLVHDASSTGERQIRAYVFAAPYRAYNIDDTGNVAQIYTTIGSKGVSFANELERRAGIALMSGPLPGRMEDLGVLTRHEGVLSLAPNAETFLIQNVAVLNRDQLSRLMTWTGELRLYAFGKITYKDAFGKPRQTSFCHVYYGPERLPWGNGGFGYESWQAKYCDRFNEAN